METNTKEDKLIFFGITFITLAALTFIINYVSPISKFSVFYIYSIALLLSVLITAAKFGFKKVAMPYKNANLYLVSGIIWGILATSKWIKYYNKDNFDWIMAVLFTLVTIINWVNYFQTRKKISQ